MDNSQQPAQGVLERLDRTKETRLVTNAEKTETLPLNPF